MNKTESVQSLDNEPSRKSLVKNIFDKAKDSAEKYIFEKYILKIAAVSAIGAVALTGCATNSETNPEPTKQSEIQTPAQTKQEKKEAEDKLALEKELQDSKEAYALPKPEGWDEVDALSLEEFKILPIETRVDYAAYLNRDNKINAQRWFNITQNEEDLIPIDTVPSASNTVVEMGALTRDTSRAAVIGHWFMIEDAPDYTDIQRQKIASSLYENADTQPAQALRDAAINPNLKGYSASFYAIDGIMLADETYTDVSDIYKVTDRQGVERDAMSFTIVESDGSTFPGVVMLVHTDYTSAWVLM